MNLLDFILGSIQESIIWIQEIWIKLQMKRIEKILNSIPEEEKEEE